TPSRPEPGCRTVGPSEPRDLGVSRRALSGFPGGRPPGSFRRAVSGRSPGAIRGCPIGAGRLAVYRSSSPGRARMRSGGGVTVNKALRILLVDDSNQFLEVAARFLADQPGISIVGSAVSGEEAIRQVERLDPDVVLMDVSMPGMGGLE